MVAHTNGKTRSAVFITFSGNCKKALTFYQSCFGGILQLETFEEVLESYNEMPIVSGTLLADGITIHGSDLVHNEGRKLGNYMAVFFECENPNDRRKLIEKLVADRKDLLEGNNDAQNLIELTDAFDVRWVLAISN